MKKLILIPVIGLALVNTSCKKNEDTKNNVKAKIVGKWTFDFYASDENSNNQLDENEKEMNSFLINEITFNEDGTMFTRSQEATQAPIDSVYQKYTLSEDNKSITIAEQDGSDPGTMAIIEISDSRFTMEGKINSTSTTKAWFSLKK